MARFVVDETYAPLVIFKVDGRLNINWFGELTPSLERYIHDQQPYALLMDFRTAKGAADPRINQFWTRWTKPRRHEIHEYCIGTSLCISSVILRKIASAVVKFVNPPHPSTIHNRMHGALADIEHWASHRGLDLKLPDPDYTTHL
ncbi:MAG: hypothetical protein D6761_12630 [Candidatus Dadabacteria bacterium]|nr:MAG: hypothetical protein D6761_12630 [Candidatus Dadabacteria bacterium]